MEWKCDGNCEQCKYYIEIIDFDAWPWSCMLELPKIDF